QRALDQRDGARGVGVGELEHRERLEVLYREWMRRTRVLGKQRLRLLERGARGGEAAAAELAVAEVVERDRQLGLAARLVAQQRDDAGVEATRLVALAGGRGGNADRGERVADLGCLRGLEDRERPIEIAARVDELEPLRSQLAAIQERDAEIGVRR